MPDQVPESALKKNLKILLPVEKRLRILVVPLDWGLGHTTRCMPVIRYLLSQGHEVMVAGENPAAGILKVAFPQITVLPLEGYRISYSKKRSGFMLRIVWQVPKILRAIRRERLWLRELLSAEHFDLVISDNRYGLHLPGIRSVILTHQLHIISGMGKVADRILQRFHYRLLSRFTNCWIVDRPGRDNLGGALSHPGVLPGNARYTGWLSRFSGQAKEAGETAGQVLILISGPEPSRSLFESELLKQAAALTQYRFVVAAGAPGAGTPPGDVPVLPSHIRYHPYLGTSDLLDAILGSELVICRSGYSTLMDLAVLRKKALLVPTPGQTEQEYLGKWLYEQGACLAVRQEYLNLEKDIPEALTLAGFSGIKAEGTDFREAVDAAIAEAGSF